MVAAQLSGNPTGCAHLFSGHVLFFLLSRKQPGLVQCLPDMSVNEHNAPAVWPNGWGVWGVSMFEPKNTWWTICNWFALICNRAFAFGVIHLWGVVTWTVASSPVQIAFDQMHHQGGLVFMDSQPQNIRQAPGWPHGGVLLRMARKCCDADI